MVLFNIHEAKTKFSQLLELVGMQEKKDVLGIGVEDPIIDLACPMKKNFHQ